MKQASGQQMTLFDVGTPGAANHAATRVEKLCHVLGFDAVFQRTLSCPVDSSPDTIISPVESKIEKVSRIRSNGRIEEKTILGRQRFIQLADTLSEQEYCDYFTGGIYVKQYLAQWHLHNVAFPANGKVVYSALEPGNARPLIFNKSADLKNEKLISVIRTKFGFDIGLIMIGSWLVRGLHGCFDMDKEYRRGAPFGYFHLGSSVILLFPEGSVRVTAQESEKVMPGDVIARVEMDND